MYCAALIKNIRRNAFDDTRSFCVAGMFDRMFLQGSERRSVGKDLWIQTY